MKIEITLEEMTVEKKEEAAEAMAAILIRHLLEEDKQPVEEQKTDNQ